MSATGRELVWQTLRFENPCRVPRQLWMLPWAEIHYPEAVKEIQVAFPPDILGAPGFHREPVPCQGCNTAVGAFVDEFGCEFVNIQEGVIGEVKNPRIKKWNRDADLVRFPVEHFTLNVDEINAWCADHDEFVLAGCCPRPFEQMQFLRGTAELYVDFMERPEAMMDFLGKLHDFYCRLLECWARTDVDALTFMDDWGTQQSLLIPPSLWQELFKPLYKDYIDIAHGAGKAAFMHSDGHILDIYPDLLDLGLDAVNSQVFCMGVDSLVPFAGKITFWGEIDRQHLLVDASPEAVSSAVRQVRRQLWKEGGCIAQCEFGPGAKPENVSAVFKAWNEPMDTVAS